MAARSRRSRSRAKQRRKNEKRRDTWELGCKSGKRMYPTRSEAERQIKTINARNRAEGNTKVLQRAYLCDRCGQWHVTSWE